MPFPCPCAICFPSKDQRTRAEEQFKAAQKTGELFLGFRLPSLADQELGLDQQHYSSKIGGIQALIFYALRQEQQPPVELAGNIFPVEFINNTSELVDWIFLNGWWQLKEERHRANKATIA